MDSPPSNFLFSTNTCNSCLQIIAFCRKNIRSSILCVLSEQLLPIFFWNWMGLTLFVYLVTSAKRRQPTLHFSYGDLHANFVLKLFYYYSWYEDSQNVWFVFL
jgi:hypothetical protein